MSTQTPEKAATVLTAAQKDGVDVIIENNIENIEHVKTEMEKLKIDEQPQTQLIDLSVENQKQNADNHNNLNTKHDLTKETIYATPLRKLDRPKAKAPSTNHDPKPNNSDDTMNGTTEDRHILNFLKDTSKLQKKLQRSGCGSGNNSSGDSDYGRQNFSSLAQEQHFVNLVQQNVIGYSENATQETDSTTKDDETAAAPKGDVSLGDGVTADSMRLVPLNGTSEYLPKISEVFIKREWIIKLIALCLEQRLSKQTKLTTSMALGGDEAVGESHKKSSASSRMQQKATSQPHNGVFLLGSNGSGKTSICKRIINGNTGTQGMLNRRLLCCYFLNTQNSECHSLSTFIRCVVMQILSHSTLLSSNKDDGGDSANHSKNSNDISSETNTAALDTTLMDTTSLVKPNEEAKDEPKPTSQVIDRRKDECENSKEKSTKTQMVRQNSETNKSGGAKNSNRDSTYDTYPPQSQKTNDPKPTTEQNQCFTPSKSKTTRGSSKIPVKIGKSGSPSISNTKETPNTSPGKKLTENKLIIQVTEEKSEPNKEPPDIEIEYENVEIRKKSSDEPKIDEKTKGEKVEPEIENDHQPQPPPKTKSCLQTIADEYFSILTQNPEIMDSLNADNIEKNPDECFKKAVLYPLLELQPPKSALLFLVDSIDEHYINEEENVMSTLKGSSTMNRSRTIAELLANNFHLIPKWLFLVLTAKRQSRHIVKKFNLFKKCNLDDLRKSNVVKDVQVISFKF